MTDTQRGMILLMKSAVTGDCYPLPESFSLEDALPLIRANHILPLAYTGAANCGISTKSPVMQSIFPRYLQAMLHAENQDREAARIFHAFEENGIDFLPLKGCNMRPLYPRPELRYMGDADILIRTEQYDRIRPVMEALGFQEDSETDHELVWKSAGLYVELHKHLIPSYTKDYHDYFGNGWQLAKPASGSRFRMSPEDEFIFLFIHFAKHYRDGGAGCRYVLDLWLFLRKYPELDTAYIRRELTMLRVAEFYNNILRLMDSWFNGGEADALTDFMTDFIISSGSWGQHNSRLVSVELRDSVSLGSIRAKRIQNLLFVLFPPAEIVAKRYPAVEKYPWLLPVFWPVRWITALLFRRDRIRNEKEYQQTVAADQLKARQEALKHVGLDFQF